MTEPPLANREIADVLERVADFFDPELGARIHQELSTDGLEEFELAAHDGQLDGLEADV